jgi:hypothetical protein
MLLVVTTLKLLTEVALLSLLGRFLLGLLAGAKREQNPFYQVLGIITRPPERLVRLISPKQILDRHIPVATACLLLSTWLVCTVLKIQICLQVGVQQCQ